MRNILFYMMFLTSIIVDGQTFDFYNQMLSDGTTGIIPNDNFTFSINNINTFKYNIFVDGERVNYNTDSTNLKEFLKILSTNSKTLENKENGEKQASPDSISQLPNLVILKKNLMN